MPEDRGAYGAPPRPRAAWPHGEADTNGDVDRHHAMDAERDMARVSEQAQGCRGIN